VAVVAELTEGGKNPISQAKLKATLGVSKASVSYRVTRLLKLGYLVNQEDRKGRPARILLGAPLPEEVEPLPSPCQLVTYLVDSSRHELVQDWIDPVSGESHDCRRHEPVRSTREVAVLDERMNTGPAPAPRARSQAVPTERERPERLDAPMELPAVDRGGVHTVQSQYERSVDGEGKPLPDHHSTDQPEEASTSSAQERGGKPRWRVPL
jgi:biotin operon repressor